MHAVTQYELTVAVQQVKHESISSKVNYMYTVPYSAAKEVAAGMQAPTTST